MSNITDVFPAHNAKSFAGSTSVLLGGIVQSFLLAFILDQASKYYYLYKEDRWMKKTFVGIVVFLSVLQTVLADSRLWPPKTEAVNPASMIWTDAITNGLTGWFSQVFFIKRCWKMTKLESRWVLYLLYGFSVTLLASNVFAAVNLSLVVRQCNPLTDICHDKVTILDSMLRITFSYWIFGSLLLDVTVASMLIRSLWKAKTGLEHSDRVVWSVIILTCKSTALPCVCMLVAVALYHMNGLQANSIGVVVFFLMLSGKFYSYGLLLTLNSREEFRERLSSRDLGIARATLSDWQWPTKDCTELSSEEIIRHAASARRESDTLIASITEPPKSFDTYAPQRANTRIATHEIISDEKVTTAVVQSPRILSSPLMDAFEKGTGIPDSPTPRKRVVRRSSTCSVHSLIPDTREGC